jgi:hypothetical protein
MFAKTINELLQSQSYIFKADFLPDYVERYVRESRVHRTQYSQQHCAVAHARIKNTRGRWARMNVREFQRNATGDHPLFAARVDE